MLVSVVWLYLWSTPLIYRALGGSLERDFPPVALNEVPPADAIVLLGGGMAINTNTVPQGDMQMAADRVWYAAQLFKAHKAPRLLLSGKECGEATMPLLRDLGIPENVVIREFASRNTEENARFAQELLLASRARSHTHHTYRILLVTSAWHMRRALLLFRKFAPKLEIIPAPTDYEALVNAVHPLCALDFIPSADLLNRNSVCFKECLGYWGYRLFRR